MTIHRAALNGRPACGAEFGKVNTTGVIVTCPHCLEASKPLSKEDAMKQIMDAAARFRATIA